MKDFNEDFDGWLGEALQIVNNQDPLYGGEVEEISMEEIDEWFQQLGLDTEATEAVTLVGNTRGMEYWAEHPHDWDQTLPHLWTDDELWECDPFYGEEWLRYDPREGF